MSGVISGLEELYAYKNKLMEDILTNEKLVELLDGVDSFADAHQLAYKQVFPYEFVPDTIEYGHSFICFDVDILSVDSKTYLNSVINVWVFSHKSKLRLPEGGVRPDEITSEIVRMLNGSRYYGLGELDLRSVRRFAPLTDFLGKSIIFDAKDFNRTSPTGKPIPSNRKSG